MTNSPDNSNPADSRFSLIRMPRSASREEKRAKLLEALANLGVKPQSHPEQEGGPENGSAGTCGKSGE